MVAAGDVPTTASSYDRFLEVKAFDDTKAGVKGLVDAGITKIPRIFVRPPGDPIPAEQDDGKLGSGPAAAVDVPIPVIDLGDSAAVDGARRAAESSGFFQLVNHGIPGPVIEEMMRAARAFHEQPQEAKRVYHSRELDGGRVKFFSNFDLYKSKFANWRDTLFCQMGPGPLDPLQLPEVCREALVEYSKHVSRVGDALFRVLSEALGLGPERLIEIGCSMGHPHPMQLHYYPPCPEPHLTMGTSAHSDPVFLTVLLQDHVGGLQVFHHNRWVDVSPIPGALVVNIGDLLQLVSNGKFQSSEHRVVAKEVGPRVSVAYFFTPQFCLPKKVYGPIKELLSEDSPPLYSETSIEEFYGHHFSKALDGKSTIAHFRL